MGPLSEVPMNLSKSTSAMIRQTKDRSTSLPSLASRGKTLKVTTAIKRSMSTPGTDMEIIAVKSAMRVSSLNESLHKKGLTKSSRKVSVEWDEIRIREYARALGDNPSCSSGPPVSIGWEYSPKEIRIKVGKYEEKRPPRRQQSEMILPREVRFKMLTQEWDVSRADCANATRESLKLKNQRKRTVHNLGKVNPKVEEAMESVGRKFKLGLSFKKKQSAKEMMAEADKAAAALAAAASKNYVWEEESAAPSYSEEVKTTKGVADFDATDSTYDKSSDEDEPVIERAPPRSTTPKTKPIVIHEA